MSASPFERIGRPRHDDVLTPAEWEVLAGVREGLSNREVAESLLAGGYRIQVFATLERSADGGYEWSSSLGPDQAISAGTTSTARVAVERRRPITFVLPFLRELTGTD